MKNGVSEERKKTPRTSSKHHKKEEENNPVDDNLMELSRIISIIDTRVLLKERHIKCKLIIYTLRELIKIIKSEILSQKIESLRSQETRETKEIIEILGIKIKMRIIYLQESLRRSQFA